MRALKTPRPFLLAIAVLVVLGTGAGTVSMVVAQGAKRVPRTPPKKVTGGKVEKGGPVSPTGWKEIDRLIAEQKLEEASQALAKLRIAAREARNEADWTRALVKEVQLRTALHGYETAVRFLKDEPWPQGFLARATLQLFYAHSLVTYVQAYQWEIGQREKVETKGAVDLKAWTKEQLYQEAERAYLDVWKDRERLGNEPVDRLSEYMTPNSYPREVRGTLRDAVSYLFVDLLGDTAGWRPEQENEVYALPLPALLEGDPKAGAPVPLADPLVHPLVRIGAVLSDLEAWHRSAGHPEAELEARLEWLRRLHASFTEEADRARIREHLKARLPGFRKHPWWAAGMAELAQMVRDEPAAGNLVRARAIALEGRTAFPDSVGGQRCRSLQETIEAPDFQVSSMSSDAPARRSLEVTHKNLPRLYFRAYPLDLEKRFGVAKDWNLLPQARELKELVAAQKPVAEWTAELPSTPDYKSHRTFVTPPLAGKGAYVVVGSARQDYAAGQNRLVAAVLVLTDLVLLSRQDDGGGWEALALSGGSGKPIAGVKVSLYKFDWQTGHQRLETRTTAKDGLARFAFTQDRASRSHFLFGRLGDDVALDAHGFSFYRAHVDGETSSSLVYTDRSIYRPLQKVFWKVVAFQGRGSEGRFKTVPEATFNVSLMDPNYQQVETRTVKTNAFGSAAGEFVIPTGRVLGVWQVQSSYNGTAQIRVEEYKRPTFEATFREQKEPMRLNRPATLTGEVKYYFGLPVTTGAVKWRVTREPVYPWWWGWWWWGSERPAGRAAQTVASGTATLKDDGTFPVSFTPQADERKAKQKAVSYRYRVTADVTDEGGETRTAERSFRLGFVAVEARVESETAFFREGAPAELKVTRASLDGAPRAGKGTWRLLRLAQPRKTLLPAEQPVPQKEEGVDRSAQDVDFETPGDRQRPRWAQADPWERALRGWAEDGELAKGELSHDEKGEARAALGKLKAGAYRLRYETTDEFGAVFETQKELLVAAEKTPVALPALLIAESGSVKVGEIARILVASGLEDQVVFLDVYRSGKRVERRVLEPSRESNLVELPVTEEHRGGFGVALAALRDHQMVQLSQPVFVPWDDKELKVEMATFRDRLAPGAKETFRVKVSSPSGAPLGPGATELLAYMYDRSLDIFATHAPPSVSGLYPYRAQTGSMRASLGQVQAQWFEGSSFPSISSYPSLSEDRLQFYGGYGIGGVGRRMRGGVAGGVMAMAAPAPAAPAVAEEAAPARQASAKASRNEMADAQLKKEKDDGATDRIAPGEPRAPEAPVALRADFSETAFWRPNLLTEADGTASIEFTVPDSVTAWNVWVHALTRDLKGGSIRKDAQSVKDLMVRPYLPRFLREGDLAELKVVVNNASAKELKGTLTFEVFDPETNESLAREFGLSQGQLSPSFTVKPGGGTNLTFPLSAPKRVGQVAFKVVAKAGDLSDGELRPLPLLPSRMHLVQSRFVTLRNKDRKVLRFADLAADDDPTRIHEQMVVTVDAQLFYTALQALPYLVNYPYECTEQTLNRFVSTGIVSSLYKDYPAIGKMALQMSKRDVRLETWDAADPNRKMALEETPWLQMARGGDVPYGLSNVLDPRVAKAERDASLAKLRKAQTSLGAFPWWPGGPPSPYMTLYIMHGFAKASEFGVDVPKDMVQRGWQYLAGYYRGELKTMMAKDCCWEFLSFLNYVASSYPDASFTGDALTMDERKEILDYCFARWKKHSPYLKGYLALTLKRMGRLADGRLVWQSVMDSAKTNDEQGTFWAAEDRSWLWYNDVIETHAFALRTLMELTPEDRKKDGLVQWILLNKKLNQWKSTRATAEVIYSLIHYLKAEGALGIREDAKVTIGSQTVSFVFEPDVYTGKKNQIVVPGDKVDPKTMSEVTVEKTSKGFAFASATWHFSTDRLPEEDRGDFFAVSRKYFKREQVGQDWVLKPLAEGAALSPGDQVEVQVSLRSKHAAEYVHLRDPRAAGLEPENAVSRIKWDLGIVWYEETRDSGTNFFFEWLPQGEYTFKYRLRANMAGTFRVGPATVQSMYAPEFNAYSAGHVLKVVGGEAIAGK